MAESALDKRKDQKKREMSVRWPEEMERWWLYVRLSHRRTMVGGETRHWAVRYSGSKDENQEGSMENKG